MSPKTFEIKFDNVDKNKVQIIPIKNMPDWWELSLNILNDYANGWEDSFCYVGTLEVGKTYDKSYLADFLDKLKLAETRLFECWGNQ